MHLALWKFQSLSILQGLFLFLCDFSHESEHTKLMTLVIINLPFAVFYLQSRSCEVINKSQCDLKFFQQQLFLLCPPWPISMTLLFLKVFHLHFLCANLATPIISYLMFFNLRCACRAIHPENCSPAPSLVGFNCLIIFQSLLLEFSFANQAPPIAQDHLLSKL